MLSAEGHPQRQSYGKYTKGCIANYDIIDKWKLKDETITREIEKSYAELGSPAQGRGGMPGMAEQRGVSEERAGEGLAEKSGIVTWTPGDVQRSL